MKRYEEIAHRLGRMRVETGSIICMGCGFEHGCGVHGCAVLREAQKLLLEQGQKLEAREGEGISPYADGDMRIEACPCCGSGEYLHNQDENQNRYCGQCGQRIKWD